MYKTMDWKSVKMLLASTITIAVASQVIKKIYKSLCKGSDFENIEDKNIKQNKENYTREINDVIIFSDQMTYHYIKVPPNKELKLCESREHNCFKLLKYIKSAQETLDVCMYLITSNEIAEQIIRLGQRHILIRVIVDGDMAHSGGSQVKRLKEYGFIKVQTSKKSVLMHHKFCIIDGPIAVKRKNKLRLHAEKLNPAPTNLQHIHKTHKAEIKIKNTHGFVMSGSLNWSTQALTGNCDNVVVTSQPTVVHKFEKEFASLWMEDEPGLCLKDQNNE